MPRAHANDLLFVSESNKKIIVSWKAGVSLQGIRTDAGLMDLRMLHLINSSVSDDHHAGRRSEVYLLDLSQYSGARLKRNLRVLDFVKDHLVLKRTQGEESPRVGDTPKKLVDILRRGPAFALASLSGAWPSFTRKKRGQA